MKTRKTIDNILSKSEALARNKNRELSNSQYLKSKCKRNFLFQNFYFSHSGFTNNFSEVIFKNQMQKVDKNKSIKINGYKELKNELYLKELKNVITFNCGDSSWERNLFDSDLIFKEDTPLISRKI